jgi:hypothetical protein
MGYKSITEKWTGDKPLEIHFLMTYLVKVVNFKYIFLNKIPQVLLIHYTLLYSFTPIKFPKNLIIPDSNTGHKKKLLKFFLGIMIRNGD